MKINFLQASVPLTKTYKKTPGGIEKSSYPHMFEVTSFEESVTNLKQFEDALKHHSKLGHCLLKGELTRTLVSESRRDSTDRNGTTNWICLDIDGLPDTFASPTGTINYDIPELLKDLGLGDISYVLQWSASHGITDSNTRAHVFMMLDKPVAVALIKQWLIQLNHTTASLISNSTLTKTACALSWVLDITACQNDKLIYIASPQLIGLNDPFTGKHRISLVRKTNQTFAFPGHVNSITTNRALTDKRIGDLRTLASIPKRKMTYRMAGPHEVLAKPDTAVVTEMRTERGFVYFNLNGGDSWAYYHPENNPDYIFNFKGEPVYVTKELMPDYWAELCGASSRTDSAGITYLAFLDRKTSTYWRGTFDSANDVLDLNPARSETMLRHFAGQYGLPLSDDIPEWDMSFDPHDNVRVDFDNHVINTFQQTQFMKAAVRSVQKCPPTIFRVIHHALGGDADITEHFMNWVAFILQERDRTRTAWVMHGTTGTGKGILMNSIIKPLFGENQTTVKRMEEFGERYNEFMEKCFICFVDEVQTKSLMNERGVMANLKNYITEKTISIRAMYTGPKLARNYCNMIFASNMPDPVALDREDRRFNVGKYQTQKLVMTDKDMDNIAKELQSFHDYLMGFKVDAQAASTPLETEDRNILINISENSLDSTSRAILDGRMGFFIDQLPSSDKHQSNLLLQHKVEIYKATIKELMERTDPATGKVHISRDELQVLFRYCNDKVPESSHKFTTMLKHHRIHTIKVRIGAKTPMGMAVTWTDTTEFKNYVKEHFAPIRPAVPDKIK